MDGELMVIDWKNSTAKKEAMPKIYPEYEYQVSAYVEAYNEQNKMDIKKAGILVLAKDKIAYNYRTLHINVIEAMFHEVFLPALSIYNFQNKNKNTGGSF